MYVCTKTIIAMDNFILKKTLIIVTVFSLVLTSCNETQKSTAKTENGIDFDTLKIEKQHFLDDIEDNPSCNLIFNLVFPLKSDRFELDSITKVFTISLFGPDYDQLSVPEAVRKYTDVYIENYITDAKIYQTNKPREDLNNYFDDIYLSDGEHADLPDIFYSYFENISNKIVFNQHGVLSFQIVQENNKGGMVSYENIRNYAINLESGKLINEEEFFSAGYDEALRPVIQSLLMAENNVKNIRDLEDLGYFGIEEIVPNKNFLITEKGIVYTFNKGEYSAYQLPATEILIPFSSVRSLLRSESLIKRISEVK